MRLLHRLVDLVAVVNKVILGDRVQPGKVMLAAPGQQHRLVEAVGAVVGLGRLEQLAQEVQAGWAAQAYRHQFLELQQHTLVVVAAGSAAGTQLVPVAPVVVALAQIVRQLQLPGQQILVVVVVAQAGGHTQQLTGTLQQQAALAL